MSAPKDSVRPKDSRLTKDTKLSKQGTKRVNSRRSARVWRVKIKEMSEKKEERELNGIEDEEQVSEEVKPTALPAGAAPCLGDVRGVQCRPKA